MEVNDLKTLMNTTQKVLEAHEDSAKSITNLSSTIKKSIITKIYILIEEEEIYSVGTVYSELYILKNIIGVYTDLNKAKEYQKKLKFKSETKEYNIITWKL